MPTLSWLRRRLKGLQISHGRVKLSRPACWRGPVAFVHSDIELPDRDISQLVGRPVCCWILSVVATQQRSLNQSREKVGCCGRPVGKSGCLAGGRNNKEVHLLTLSDACMFLQQQITRLRLGRCEDKLPIHVSLFSSLHLMLRRMSVGPTRNVECSSGTCAVAWFEVRQKGLVFR